MATKRPRPKSKPKPDLDLDLDTGGIPPYHIKAGGKIHEFDSLRLAFKLENALGDKPNSPEELTKKIEQILGFKVSTLHAIVFVKQFSIHMEQFEAPLKKVFGQSLPLTTSTESNPQNSAS